MTEQTARQLIEKMPEDFRPKRARGVDAVVQFQLSGEGGGSWYVVIKGGNCEVVEGVNDSAQATVRMTASDYVALSTGKLGGMRAYLTGRVKISGDQTLLRKMQKWFPQ